MINHSRWLFAALILSSCSSVPEHAGNTLLLTPYLQAVTDTSAYVLVETTSPAPVTVEYGPNASSELLARTDTVKTTEALTYVHNIQLHGLTTGGSYHYRVDINGGSSNEGNFTTAPPAGTEFRFAWMADTRGDTTVHDSIAQRVLLAHPALLLFGGDTGPTSDYRSFKTYFFRPAQRKLLMNIPFFNATGNHEKWSVNTKAFTRAPASASGSQAYYSFDWGDAHVLVLNNEVPYGPGTPQYAFAANDLASTRRTWKIVISHKPAYCGGGHNEDEDMKKLTSEVFEPHGVALVMSGHSHFFQHNLVHGIHHMVIGSAGAPLYQPEHREYTVASAKSYNYAIGDVGPHALQLVVFDEKGDRLDSLDLRK